MTGTCLKLAQAGIVQCSCPVFTGPYRGGKNDQACTLGGGLTWSAASAPPATPTATPAMSVNAYKMMSAASAGVPAAVPSPNACLPGAPGALGCPLDGPRRLLVPPHRRADCAQRCDDFHHWLQPQRSQGC